MRSTPIPAQSFRRYTPDSLLTWKIYSIDEAFLDVTTTHHLFGGPEAIGSVIKREIRKRFGIACTIGIGPNILIAKLLSDMSKPDGLRWMRQEDVGEVLEGLPVEELWGIGRGDCGETREDRHQDLWRARQGPCEPPQVQIRHHRRSPLKEMGKGIWEREVIVREREPKSIGHSMTLPRDISGREDMEAQILKLSDMVGTREVSNI